MQEAPKSKKTLWIVLILLLLIILGFILVYIFILSKPKTGPLKVKVPDVVVDVSKPGVYEDERVKFTYPAGWERKDIADPYLKGVQLTKAQYVFTVVTNYVQASGVEGGRFSEIAAQVAPWLAQNDVMSCVENLSNEPKTVKDSIQLHNLYFTPSGASVEARAQCGDPTIRGVLWYGSYFSDNGYFIGKPENKQIIAGIYYAVDSANKLPYKGDSNLQHVLEETSEMVKGMQIKTPTTADDAGSEFDK